MLSKSKLKLIFYTIIALSGNLIYSSSPMSDDELTLRMHCKKLIAEFKKLEKKTIALNSEDYQIQQSHKFEFLVFKSIQNRRYFIKIMNQLLPKLQDSDIDIFKKAIEEARQTLVFFETIYKKSYGEIGKASKYATTACGAGAPSVVSASTVAIADDLPPLVAITPLNIELYELRNPYLNNPYWEDVNK